MQEQVREDELPKLRRELDQYELDIEKGIIKAKMKTHRDKVLAVYELMFLDRATKDGASQAVQFGILNMRLEERQARRKW